MASWWRISTKAVELLHELFTRKIESQGLKVHRINNSFYSFSLSFTQNSWFSKLFRYSLPSRPSKLCITRIGTFLQSARQPERLNSGSQQRVSFDSWGWVQATASSRLGQVWRYGESAISCRKPQTSIRRRLHRQQWPTASFPGRSYAPPPKSSARDKASIWLQPNPASSRTTNNECRIAGKLEARVGKDVGQHRDSCSPSCSPRHHLKILFSVVQG